MVSLALTAPVRAQAVDPSPPNLLAQAAAAPSASGASAPSALSFSLPRNGIVGVIGPNGVGKTTLFKMILGEEKQDSGDIKVGETVSLSYVDQSRMGLDGDKNVWQLVSDELDYMKVGQVEVPSRAYVAAFGFTGPD